MHWPEYLAFLAIVLAAANPLGNYLANVFEGKPVFGDRVLRPVETFMFRLLGVRPEREMTAGVYTLCFALFGVAGTAFLFLLLQMQHWLPFGPADSSLTTAMTWDLAINTAASFGTTTTWQAYGGETTMRYLSQLLGLAAQNFLGAAAGLAAGFAFIRGFARDRSDTIGNFWVDLIRALVRVLLPCSLIGGLILVWQGVPMNLNQYVQATVVS